MKPILFNDDLYTIKELAERLRVHPSTIYQLLREGRLPGFRVGGSWRFHRAKIEQWERLQTLKPPQPVTSGWRWRGE
jgi:excisionase family DNA binding protein